MTKIYDRKDPAFVSTLLLPPTDDVLVRLMSPQDRGRLAKKKTPSVGLLMEALSEVADSNEDFNVDQAEQVMCSYLEKLADSIGPYADYPEDFNYLANAIGSSPSRYESWFLELGGLHVTPGVTTIFAATGAGKTTMADLLAFNLIDRFTTPASIMRVKLGESGSDTETFLRFSELAEALPEQLPPVLIIDSVRLQTFDMGGASRSLSISNRLFRWLTEVDIFAVGHGVAVILVMNPLAGEADKIEQFRGDVESSVMSVINLDSWNSGTFKHRGEKNARQEQRFELPGEIARTGRAMPIEEALAEVASPTIVASSAQAGGRTAYGRQVTTKP